MQESFWDLPTPGNHTDVDEATCPAVPAQQIGSPEPGSASQHSPYMSPVPDSLSGSPASGQNQQQTVLMQFGRRLSPMVPLSNDVDVNASRPVQCRFCPARFKDNCGRGGHEATKHTATVKFASQCEGSDFWNPATSQTAHLGRQLQARWAQNPAANGTVGSDDASQGDDMTDGVEAMQDARRRPQPAAIGG